MPDFVSWMLSCSIFLLFCSHYNVFDAYVRKGSCITKLLCLHSEWTHLPNSSTPQVNPEPETTQIADTTIVQSHTHQSNLHWVSCLPWWSWNTTKVLFCFPLGNIPTTSLCNPIGYSGLSLPTYNHITYLFNVTGLSMLSPEIDVY